MQRLLCSWKRLYQTTNPQSKALSCTKFKRLDPVFHQVYHRWILINSIHLIFYTLRGVLSKRHTLNVIIVTFVKLAWFRRQKLWHSSLQSSWKLKIDIDFRSQASMKRAQVMEIPPISRNLTLNHLNINSNSNLANYY